MALFHRAAEREAEAARAERELSESRAQQRGREEEQTWTAKLREAKLGALVRETVPITLSLASPQMR